MNFYIERGDFILVSGFWEDGGSHFLDFLSLLEREEKGKLTFPLSSRRKYIVCITSERFL
jgi:hypothetical protein